MGKVLVALAMMVFAFAISCGSKPKAPGCKSDKDCSAGLVCGDNKCVECNDDSACGTGKHCEAHGCVAKAECERDDQCPDGQRCQAGACKPCAAGEACTKPKKCGKDEDCADDEDCKNGFCTKATQTTAGDAACTLQTVYFAFDDSSIQGAERDHLDGDAQCMDKSKTKNVLVVGHTDSSGTEEYNIALSERRAQSVADYLARLGVDPARMQVVPKGETEPTGMGDDKDRRVDFQWH